MDIKLLTIRTLVSTLTSPSDQTRLAALRHLHLISNQDPTSRPLIASSSSAIPLLIASLYSFSHSIQDHASATLLNLSISLQSPLLASPTLFPALTHILSHHNSSSSPAAVQSSAATLHSLLSTLPNFCAANHLDLLRALMDIIATPHSHVRSIKDALKASFSIVLHPPNRTIMIRLGAVAVLFSLLDRKSKRLKTGGIIEDATAVIAQIAGCEESEETFRKVSGIPVLAGLLGLNSTGSCGGSLTLRTKENAVSGLLNLVRCGGERVVGEVRERGEVLLDGIMFVQQHGSAKGKSKAVMLMKLLLDDGGSSSNNKILEDLYPIESN